MYMPCLNYQYKDVLTGLNHLHILFFFLEDRSTTLPTLSLLTSSESGPNQQICLAAGFFPKNDSVYESMKDTNDNAQLSTSGTYYYAGSSEKAIENCKKYGENENAENENGDVCKCS